MQIYECNCRFKILAVKKEIQGKFFTVDQNVGKSLICILTKLLLTSGRFQDIMV